MKKIALITACIATMTLISCNESAKKTNVNPSGVNAQAPTTTPNAREGQVGTEVPDLSKMYDELELTDRQKDKLDDVQKKYEDKMKNTGDRGNGQKMDEATREAMEHEISAILTPDQKKKYAKMKRGGNGY